MKCLKELRDIFEEFKQDIKSIRECDDCTKGPCIGRLLRNDVGWTTPNAIYIVDSNIYASRCAMLIKYPKLAVKLERDDKEINVFYPASFLLRREKSAKPSDILINNIILGF